MPCPLHEFIQPNQCDSPGPEAKLCARPRSAEHSDFQWQRPRQSQAHPQHNLQESRSRTVSLIRTNLTTLTTGFVYAYVVVYTSRRALSVCSVQVYVSHRVSHRAAKIKRWRRLLPVLGAQLLEVQSCSKQSLGLYSVTEPDCFHLPGPKFCCHSHSKWE